MKICAIVIVYNPDRELLMRNIAAFADGVDKIIVWRNSDFDESWLDQWKGKILLWGDGFNEMIARPVNKAMEWARKMGYRYLLTMDQDSRWNSFGLFLEAVGRCGDSSVGIYAPNVNNYLRDPAVEYRDIEWVIQSGMLIDLDAVAGLGGFREDYGIYGIDEEFCYWLRLNGKKIRSFTNHHLVQKYGDARKTAWGFTVLNYSPFARYHIVRNMIWMKREFPQSTVTRRIPHVIFDNCRDILLAEDNKIAKLKGLARGVADGLFKKILQCRVSRS